MGQTLKRHNLLFSDDEWQILVDKSKELKISVSEFVRKTMTKEIEEMETTDLLNYINKNCDYMTIKEENEIMKILEEDDSNDLGVELTVEAILQG
jgi:hypothetical protein